MELYNDRLVMTQNFKEDEKTNFLFELGGVLIEYLST